MARASTVAALTVAALAGGVTFAETPQATASGVYHHAATPGLPPVKSQAPQVPPERVYAEMERRGVYRSVAYPGQLPVARMSVPAADQDRTSGFAEVRTGWDHAGAEHGVLYGLGAGVDRRFGDFFVGGYAAIDWTTTQIDPLTTLMAGAAAGTTDEVTFAGDLARDIELGLRAGYHVTDDWTVYALAALSTAKREVETVTVNVTPATDATPELRSIPLGVAEDRYEDGFRVGVGTDYVVFRDLYLKAEYRYTNYGDVEADRNFDRHQVVTGLGLRF
jgi:outer membrane immunogenic protein